MSPSRAMLGASTRAHGRGVSGQRQVAETRTKTSSYADLSNALVPDPSAIYRAMVPPVTSTNHSERVSTSLMLRVYRQREQHRPAPRVFYSNDCGHAYLLALQWTSRPCHSLRDTQTNPAVRRGGITPSRARQRELCTSPSARPPESQSKTASACGRRSACSDTVQSCPPSCVARWA